MIRIPSILFWFGLIIVTSIVFYRISDHVQALNGQLHDLNTSIESEQKNIHVLKAEWAYLSNPERVEAEAKKHLLLRPTLPRQIVPLDNLDDTLPMRGEHTAAATTPVAPAAVIKASFTAAAPQSAPASKPKAMIAMAMPTKKTNSQPALQHTASAQPASDSIGQLITRLDTRQ